jgi:hypothetical protein
LALTHIECAFCCTCTTTTTSSSSSSSSSSCGQMAGHIGIKRMDKRSQLEAFKAVLNLLVLLVQKYKY